MESLNKLKTDKSPGSDNKTNESLHLATPLLVMPLTKLFNHILQTRITPTQRSESNIVLLY